jgi:hypothetical protein
MAVPSVTELFDAARDAISGIVSADAASIAGFSETQLNHLARHGVLLAKAAAAGAFADEADQEEFLNGYADMVRNFVRALVGLIALTIERIWNALVDIFWGTIERAVGFALPRPGL